MIQDLFPQIVPGRAFTVGEFAVVVTWEGGVFAFEVRRAGEVIAAESGFDSIGIAESDARKAAVSAALGISAPGAPPDGAGIQ